MNYLQEDLTHRAAQADVSYDIIKDKEARKCLGRFLLRHSLLAALDSAAEQRKQVSATETIGAHQHYAAHCSTLQLKSRFSLRVMGEAATTPMAVKTAMQEEVEKRILALRGSQGGYG